MIKFKADETGSVGQGVRRQGVDVGAAELERTQQRQVTESDGRQEVKPAICLGVDIKLKVLQVRLRPERLPNRVVLVGHVKHGATGIRRVLKRKAVAYAVRRQGVGHLSWS